MPGKFCIYSTDITPSLEPYNEDPLPSTLIRLDRDPIVEGEYEVSEGVHSRGSVNPTLGGVQVQSFNTFEEDSTIRISDDDAIGGTTKDKLRTAYYGSGEYYFTDGYDCWKVAFRKDAPITLRRNLAAAHFNLEIFSYEVNLQVLSKEI
jgi:hypothetical protein